MADTQAVASVIDAIAADTLSYALLLAAIGTLSMAFIELVKGIFFLRQRFHRNQVNAWLHDRKVRHELLVLAAGGVRYADVLFDQPVERMMGQIQAAANLSLEFPDRYPHAYAFFTEEDLEMRRAADALVPSDSETWKAFAVAMARGGGSAERQEGGEGRAAQQARVRLGNLIARRLDTFQNRTQYRWARANQIASILVGAGLSAFAITRATAIVTPGDALAVIGLSLLAGMLAPFAKDVVAAVGGIRAKA